MRKYYCKQNTPFHLCVWNKTALQLAHKPSGYHDRCVHRYVVEHYENCN